MLKLTEDIIAEMSKLFEDGIPTCYVCDYVGVHETTFYDWMKKGEEDDSNDQQSLYATLWKTIKKSCAQFIIDSNDRIKKGLPGWQGTAWWLERTNNKFMPKQQIQADDDGKVTVVIGGKEKNVKKQ